MKLKNKLLKDVADAWNIKIKEYLYSLIDMLTFDKSLLPLDLLAAFIIILSRIVRVYKADVKELEELYRNQRDVAESFFKFHNCNQKLFREEEGCGDSYSKEDHYTSSGEYPVSFSEVFDELIKSTDKGMLLKDMHISICELVSVTIHTCYTWYGYSKELEDDINDLIYKFDQEMISLTEALKGK